MNDNLERRQLVALVAATLLNSNDPAFLETAVPKAINKAEVLVEEVEKRYPILRPIQPASSKID